MPSLGFRGFSKGFKRRFRLGLSCSQHEQPSNAAAYGPQGEPMVLSPWHEPSEEAPWQTPGDHNLDAMVAKG